MGVTAQTLHGAKVCLIPKPENNYHPLALRRKALMAISGLILTAKILVVGVTVLLPSTAELSTITNSRILQLTNLKRIENNLPALKENDKLSRAAAAKAKDIIENDYFAHVSPSGVTPWFWMKQENYSYTIAGENLAIDFVQAESVVDAWMASPGHKENLLHPDYTETGVAVHTGEFEGGTSTVVVHMFGLPYGATSSSTPSPLGARAPISTAPSPSPTTTKQQTPVPSPTPLPQNTAPSTPKLTLTSPDTTYTNKVNFAIFGDKDSTINITVNNQYASTLTLKNGTSASYDLDISSFDDGKLAISAYAVNSDNKTSNKSTPIEIHKDATGPTIEKNELSFLLSPGTDTPEAIMYLPAGKYDQLDIKQSNKKLVSVKSPLPKFISFPVNQQQLQINAYDEIGNTSNVGQFSLLPAIFTERDITTTDHVHWLNDVSRRMLITVGLILLILLTLAVFIRIKIQHPKMITHTTLVILLIFILLFI